MGVPIVDVKFKELTSTAVARSERGIVALILEDDSGLSETLSAAADAQEGWSSTSRERIAMAFEGGAYRVIAMSVSEGEDGGADYEAVMKKADRLKWNWLAAPDAKEADRAKIAAAIKSARAAGKTRKAVLACASAPCSEGIVNLCTDNITSTVSGTAKTYSAAQYTPRVAGVLAALPLDRSVTGYEFYDITAADASPDADSDVDAGKFLIEYDGEKFAAVRGVTSLTVFETTPSMFAKIKHVEGADLLAEDMALIFRTRYKGRKPNTYANKQALMAELTGYLKGLGGSVLSDDAENTASVDLGAQRAWLSAAGRLTENMSERDILMSDTDEKVFAKVNVTFADAMEDVYISVVLN